MILESLSKRFGIALIEGNNQLSYSHLLSEVKANLDKLISTGIEPQSVVAFKGKLSILTLPIFLALIETDCVLIPYSDLPNEIWEGTMEKNLHDFIVICDPQFEVIRNINKVSDHPKIIALKAEKAPGLVITSSGSSGKPKLVLHNLRRMFHRHIELNLSSNISLGLFFYDHIAGIDRLIRNLITGSTLVVCDSRSPYLIGELIEKNSINHVSSTPLFWRMFLDQDIPNKSDVRALRVITFGADIMNETTLTDLKTALPWCNIQQSFGTSELGSLITETYESNALFFKLVEKNVETKIIDDQLWIKSPVQMLGYLSQEEIQMDSDGFICTGDLVCQKEKFIRIVGRSNNIINIGGEKFFPSEVEDVLMEHPCVSQVVIEASDSELGRFIQAKIVLKPHCTDILKIRTELRLISKKITNFKRPARYIFQKEMSATTRLKVDR